MEENNEKIEEAIEKKKEAEQKSKDVEDPKKKKMWKGILIVTSTILAMMVLFFIYIFWLAWTAPMEKPIIYLYPTQETEVAVKLKNSELITSSYPKYTSGWNVIAKEDGKLVDLDTGRNLYSLYYESKGKADFKVEDEGFIVKREDTIKFLEEKLNILGLNEYEAEEFIVYWLPRLEKNKYNYIRFANIEEINENMPLEITPTPDTTIRILMTFKGLEKPITVTEQKLTNVDRNGFVAVEWGGTEIK